MLHIECFEKSLVRDDEREQVEHDTGLQDAQQHSLQNVFLFIVPHLMGQDCHQLLSRMPLDECVKEHDTLVLAEAREKGVGFTG